MRSTPRLAAAASLLALALPAVAHGQSAGDNQYQDPFGSNQSGSGSSHSSGSSSSSGSTGSGTSGAPALAPGVPSGPGSEAQATTQATPAGQLPNTGSETGLIALAGTGMLMCGAGLRLRLRAPLA